MPFVETAIDISSKVLPHTFPVGRLAKLVKCGFKVTNSTNVVSVVGNITLTVIDCCTPPPARLACTVQYLQRQFC